MVTKGRCKKCKPNTGIIKILGTKNTTFTIQLIIRLLNHF